MNKLHGPTFVEQEERDFGLSFARDQIHPGDISERNYVAYVAALETLENFGVTIMTKVNAALRGEDVNFTR